MSGTITLPGSSPETSLDPPEQAVRIEVARLFASRSARASRYGDRFAALWHTASACAQGGKMVRPRLLLGAFDALSPDGPHDSALRESAIRIAAAVEVLHYAFLVHDDIIDGDLTRRGRPNLVGALMRSTGSDGPGGLHWARSSSMLVGDMLLADVHQVFAREPLPHAIRLRLLDLLDLAIADSIAGEHLDVGLSDGAVPADLGTVLDMTRLKTATYTLELPLKAATILTGASSQTEELVEQIGRRLGTAFQLQDDLLSTFGDATVHGKDPFSDLREGKETAIIAYARTTGAWPGIEPLFGDPRADAADAAVIRDRLIGCGAERFVRSLIDDELRAATELIASPEAGLPAPFARFLTQLMAGLEGRRS